MLYPEFGRFGVDPFAELRRLQSEMSRMFSGFGLPEAQDHPLVNLWLGGERVRVAAQLPGLGPDDIELTVREDLLTIQGKPRPGPDQDPGAGEGAGEGAENGKVVWHRRERNRGGFARTIRLPFRVDADNVQASFEHGILEVELRRPESDRPRKIQIRTA